MRLKHYPTVRNSVEILELWAIEVASTQLPLGEVKFGALPCEVILGLAQTLLKVTLTVLFTNWLLKSS